MKDAFLSVLAFDLPIIAPTLLAVGLFFLVFPIFDRHSNWQRMIVTGSAGFVFARYFAWRIEALLNADTEWMQTLYAWGVFSIEIIAAFEIATFFFIMSKTVNRSEKADELERAVRSRPVGDVPSVDVLIPTYDEGPEVLERTILAARAMDYPNFAVWLCDDGRDRTWLREMCRRYGVNYLSREDRSHAKAGNINNALTCTRGDLVAVFDADFAPSKQFLARTVGFFDDPEIGLVQTPQHFFNRDPIQTNLSILQAIPDEQRLFFDHMAPCRDAWGVAFCCGAGSIVRRTALEEVGGIPTGSITEDLLTSLVLLRGGFRTRYLNERLAVGLAPENMNAYVVQRRRWCRGAIQGLFLREGPLGPGLSLRDRVLFFPFGWLMQHPIRILMMLIPAIYLLTGVTPFPGLDGETVVRMVFPVIAASTGAMLWLVPGCYVPLVSTAVALHTALHVVPTVLTTLLRPFGAVFQVTPKGDAARARTVDRRGLFAAFVLGGLTIAGMLVSGAAPTIDQAAPGFNIVAVAWGGLNLIICFIMALISIDRSRPRGEERFEVGTPASVFADGEARPAWIVDLSSTGAGVRFEKSTPVGTELELDIADVGRIAARVVRADGRGGFGLHFTSMEDSVRQRLIERLFAGDLDNGIRKVRWRELTSGITANFV